MDEVRDGVHWLLTYFCPKEEYEQEVDSIGDWYNWYGLKYLLYEYEIYLVERAHLHLDWQTLQKKNKKDTIEHILPQTPTDSYWRKHWNKKDIETVLHDIGNLVITLDNSSYGNKGFDQKKGSPGEGICYANSALFSERELCKYDEWNYEAYSKRREELSLWMKERWFIKDHNAMSDIEIEEED